MSDKKKQREALRDLQDAADRAGERVRDLLERIERACDRRPEEPEAVASWRAKYINGKYSSAK